MKISRYRYLLLAAIVASSLNSAAAQSQTESKSAVDKSEVEKLDPIGRPEGAANDQSARYYLFYENNAWHVHTTAQKTRTFTGTIRVKDATIVSCVPIGLKEDKHQKITDAWQVNDARNELQFKFYTGKAADGFSLAVKGDDGQIEFDLQIDNQSNPKAIFIGRDRKHPSKSPFVYPAKPKTVDPNKKA